MKKLILIIPALLFLLPSYAQDIKVRKIKKLPVETTAYFPEFGKNNREILYTGQNHQGLYQYNRCKRKSVEIVQQTPVKSFERGKNNKIYYTIQEGTGADKKLVRKAYDLKTGEREVVPGEDLEHQEVSVDGNRILLRKEANEVTPLAPTGDNYYIWPSLSPDKTRLLFTAVRKGTFVSDLEGNIIAELGKLNAPGWLNDEWVIGMVDKDDGHVTTSSDIYAVHVPSGRKVEITAGTNEIALYPKASDDADRILFHNLNGEVFIARIRVNNQ